MRPDAKTIFLTVTFGTNVRDILRGNVLKVLKASGHRIVILSPIHDDPAFRAEFESDNVIVEPLHPHRPSRLERKVNSLRFTLFPDLCETFRILTRPVARRSAVKAALARCVLAFVRLIGRANTRRLVMWLNTYLFPDRHHADLFRRYKPDLVCVTEFFHLASDLWILKRAVRERIPTVGLVRSWDNLTTKGSFPAPIDRLVVWSETMRREAVEMHGYRPEEVFVGGVPQYDAYTDPTEFPTRGDFFRRIGADPGKRLITWALVPKDRFPEEMDIAAELGKLIHAGALGEPAQLLIRLYPLRASTVPDHLQGQPSALFDLPGTPSRFPDRNISLDDLRHLAATMRYSDVVINMASTISVDAAAMGTPVVCVAFEGEEPKPYHESVQKHYDMTHFRRILTSGGVRVARNMPDLIEHVQTYLRHPQLDADGRRRIVETECYRLDGRAGERIANFILQRLEEVTGGERQNRVVQLTGETVGAR